VVEQLKRRPHLSIFTCSTFQMLNCSIFCQKRKIPPRGVEPLSGNSKAPVNKQLTQNEKPVLATCLANLVQIYPDLAELVKAWPELPEDTKKSIKALVQKHRAEKR
jgi:hypothetical protein